MRFALPLAVALVFTPAVAQAHAELTQPAPRFETGGGIKVGECGGPRPGSPTLVTYTVGQVVTVKWDETVDHPGHYELFLRDANDANPVTINNNITDSVCGVGMIPCEYTYQWTVPNTPCSPCTLQMKQFMSGSNTYYFSCADIEIVAAASTDMAGQAPADLAGTPPADMAGATAGDLSTAAPDLAEREIDISKLGSPGCSVDGDIALPSLLGALCLAVFVTLASRRRTS